MTETMNGSEVFKQDFKTVDKKLEDLEIKLAAAEADPEGEDLAKELRDKKFALMEQLVASKS